MFLTGRSLFTLIHFLPIHLAARILFLAIKPDTSLSYKTPSLKFIALQMLISYKSAGVELFFSPMISFFDSAECLSKDGVEGREIILTISSTSLDLYINYLI